jgi:hypothetical protein
MMKATLQPISFAINPDEEFIKQLATLRELLADEAEFLPAMPLGHPVPEAAEAVIFPQLLGDAYRRLADIMLIKVPILVVTSEFGTVSMWDWEINRYLTLKGVQVIAPYQLEQTKMICRALALKRDLRQTRFLVYQDNPGAGFQAEIFKRFYWWEEECTRLMREKYGVQVVKKSFKALGERAANIPDDRAEAAWQAWKEQVSLGEISNRARLSAIKLYLAVKEDLADEPSIKGVGINCLNESHFCDTTPCLAWDLLFEEKGLLWGCEADTLSMLTKQLVYRTLGAPLMMTNLYPFLMGQAALKHERIPDFPAVAEAAQNHILAAHCGYLGVLPRKFAAQWRLRKKVLAIVDENATAIDARLAEGPVTLVKLEPDLESLSVVEGSLEGYAQFPGSDCLNGAVIQVPDGHRLMRELPSHHSILAAGHLKNDLEMLMPVFGIRLNDLGEAN